MNFKKMAASFFAAVMLAGAVSVTGLPRLTADAIEYDENDLYIVSGSVRGAYKYATDLFIPDEVKVSDDIYMEVRSISSGAFSGCTLLEYIQIGKNVSTINASFSGLKSLKEIYVHPENEKFSSVDGVLFNKSGTELIAYPNAKEDESYSVPYTVERIKSNAFSNNKYLTDVYLSIATSIDGFSGCTKLKTVEISEYTTKIAVGTFSGCTSLTDIYVYPGNTKYASVDGVLFSEDGSQLIQYPLGKKDNTYTVPEGVTEIAAKAFEGCTNLENIVLPSGLKLISNSAFSGCTGLRSLTLPESVTEIGTEAFAGCSGITDIKISDGLKKIDTGAFSECKKIKEITLPESVVEIGDNAFANCTGLMNATICGDPEFGATVFRAGIMLHGNKGSSVEQYAKDNSALLYGFTPFETVMRGDVDKDGVITLSDVTGILKHYVGIQKLPDNALENADANADGKIDLSDVTYTLKLFVGVL